MLGIANPRSRVLVTGGAGFIGTVTCRRLLDAGHDVTIVDNGAEPRHDQARATLTETDRITTDLLTTDLLTTDLVDLLDGFGYIVHLAGRPGVQTSWGAGFAEHLSVNTLLTQRLLEAALVTQPRRIVLASSSSVYGDIADGAANEDDALRPLSPYGVTKAAVESLMGAYVARGVDAVALRFFTVYGRGQRPDMALHRIIDAALGGPVFGIRGSGHQARDFTHVDDAAAAIEAALFAPVSAGTVYNVGSGRPVSLRTLIDTVEDHLGRPVPLAPLEAVSGDPGRTAANITKARRLLAWSPAVTLAAGVADQIAHQREHALSAPAGSFSRGQAQPQHTGALA